MDIRATWSVLRALWRGRDGNILMIMGFALVPMVFSVGMVIDYSRAARMQTKLNAIADASTLAAVTVPMMGKALNSACNAARNTFLNQVSDIKGVNFDKTAANGLKVVITETYASLADVTFTCPSADLAIDSSQTLPLTRATAITYTATSPNLFGTVLGSTTTPIAGTSTSNASVAPYVDIHMALDTSQSMGLAATDADALKLFNLTKAKTKEGCTFGCHAGKTGEPVSNETIARNNGVKLRVDTLKEATSDMIQTAINEEGSKKLYQFGLYRIGQTLTDIRTLTDDLPTAKSAADALTLGPTNSGGPGDSNLVDVMDNMFSKIAVKGAGKTHDTARAYMFLVTDGVHDVVGSCTSGHCTAPINATTCQRYKDANIIVGVVYTTYIPIRKDPTSATDKTYDSNYISLVQTFSLKDANNQKQTAAQIATNLRACASPGWYFEASDGPNIHAAMQKLFSQATKPPALTR